MDIEPQPIKRAVDLLGYDGFEASEEIVGQSVKGLAGDGAAREGVADQSAMPVCFGGEGRLGA